MTKDNGEEIGISVDCDLMGLKKMADDIGKDELWLRCCSISLREISRT
jgi:hypothetical protein